MEESTSETMVPSNEAEADALLNDIYAPTEESPRTLELVPEQKAEAPPEKNPLDFEDEITWRGEARKLHYNQIKNYAQQAYDYSEKMREFKLNQELNARETARQQEQFKKQQAEFESSLGAYKKVDEYAKSNPQWWNHVQSQYATLGQEGNAAQVAPQIPPQIVQKLTEMEDYIRSQKEREEITARHKDDQSLDNDISQFRQANPGVDWDTPKSFQTERGPVQMTLEKQVLQYMVDNKIGKFSAAARDFLWDDLTKKVEINAKEKVGKQIQHQNKFGGGKPAKPTGTIGRVENPSQKSYDDISAEIIKEYGLN